MSVATFEDAKSHNPKLIRKMLQGSVFVKRWDASDPEITTVYTVATGLVIPDGYVDVGLIKKSDAIAWNRDTASADVESWGYGEPTRRDLTSDVSTVAFTMQESKRQVLEIYNSTDLSAVLPDADGNVVIDKPTTPQAIRWRMFTIAKDGDGADAVYFLKALPNCQVSEISEQSWSDADELSYQVTMTGFNDPDWGTACREVWGGPGFDPAAAGFEAAGV